MNEPLGLIAGEGIFPLLVARGARQQGRRVVGIGLRGSAWPDLAGECDHFSWAGVTRMSAWIRALKRGNCSQAIMVGRVAKTRMYSPFAIWRTIPDLRTARLFLWTLRHDKRPYTVLTTIINELSNEGIELIDSTTYVKEHLASAGVMTKQQPTESQWMDIRFGHDLARQISRMDIGQAIAVLNKDVIAVEAIEGTNAMIERAAMLCRSGGWVLIKVSNTTQDMRVDVPTIGLTTIEKMREARAGCLVLDPGKTIILEKPKVLELADRYKISVVGYEGAGT